MSVAVAGRTPAASRASRSEWAGGVSEEARRVDRLVKEALQARRIPVFYGTRPEDRPRTAESFRELAERWRAETGHSSSIMHIVMHPAYQRIIGMGAEVVPLILEDLARTESHWFWALQSITGENPVPWEARGYVDRMARAWLEWGRGRGLVP
jgi:hypothetical protein